MKLIHGECLSEISMLQSNSIDAIITDPPYGTTACKWDSVIPFAPMWKELNRVIKSNGAIVLFGSEPFSSALRMSNIKNYKYDWIWDKILKTGHLNSKRMPMKQHEVISVFSGKERRTNYNPIMEIGAKPHSKGRWKKQGSENYGKERVGFEYSNSDFNYPTSLSIRIQKTPASKCIHPTQKPVALMEYLIKTYTNENETVLDFTMGSGTTGVACKNLNRNFIGIEQDEKYFQIAKQRIEGKI